MEKEIIKEIQKLMSENKELENRLYTVEKKLEHTIKTCDILFPLLFGMFLCICILVF